MPKDTAKIQFNADCEGFNAEIKKANSTMQQLRAEMKLNETQMKSTGVSVEGLENKHKILSQQLEASKDKTQALQGKLDSAIKNFHEGSVEVDKWRTQLVNAQTAEEKLRQAISQCETELNEQRQATQNSGEATETLTEKISRQQTELKQLKSAYVDAVDAFGESSDEAKALAQKIESLSSELSDNQSAFEKASRTADSYDKTLEDVGDAAKSAETATEKLTNTIEDQRSKLDKLKGEYVEAVLTYGKNSKEAKTLAKEITGLSKELESNQKVMGKAESAADRLDKSYKDAGDAARDSAEGFTVAKGAIADLASEAIQAAIGTVSEFVGWLKELPEATREIRQDMATLETSFESAGLTTEQATNTWKELYTVFGEDDRAVEAANLIAKMSDNQQDLNDWVTITTGIWGTYQDSLPVEGLAEASNETAKTGQVTGVLADALNWSSEAAVMFAEYMSEDVTTAEDAFNEALKECTTEEERQALITETLTALYGDAAAQYEEASGAQLEAKEATAENILVQNELATAIEPVTTAWQNLKNDALEAILPVVQSVSDTMTDMLVWMQEHPVAVKAIAAAVGVLAVGLGALAIAAGIYTAAQWAMNSAILANPITWIIVAVIAAIAAVVAIIVVLIEYWDEIVAAVINCWESVKATLSQWGEWINSNVIQPVANFFVGLWDDITSVCATAWEWVKDVFSSFVGWIDGNIIQPVLNFFTGLWDGMKTIWEGICNVVEFGFLLIKEIVSAAFQIITVPFRLIWETCKSIVTAVWNWIKPYVTTAINAIKTVISNVMNAIKTVFSNVWNSIKSVTSTVWNAIKSVIGTVWEWIYTKVSTVINKVLKVIQTIWNTVKSVTSTVWNAIKTVITTVWNGIKSAVTSAINAVKTTVSSIWNNIKSTTTSVWNAVKTTVSSVWNGIKSTVSGAINNVKSSISSGLNSAKSTVASVLDSIKSKFTSIWDSCKTVVSGAIEKIKSYFNFTWSLPKIKMPHISITGSFSLSPPSVPKFSISWYKDGAIFTKPTLFNTPYGLKGVGEAGAEAVLPIEKLEGYISGAIEKTQNVANLNALVNAIEDIASRPILLNVNGRQVATATASDSDSVNGLRSSFRGRGLVLD